MAVHAFRVGDIVSLRLRAAAAGGEAYEVTRLLPVQSRVPIYGIKSIGDSHERTAPLRWYWAPMSRSAQA